MKYNSQYFEFLSDLKHVLKKHSASIYSRVAPESHNRFICVDFENEALDDIVLDEIVHHEGIQRFIENIINKNQYNTHKSSLSNNNSMKILEQIYKICNGIEYSRDVPDEAKKIAKENNILIIVGGSDDLMYCFGADCYMTRYEEHGYGWDGDTLENIPDKRLELEAKQLGLKIWWCGKILADNLKIEGYDVDKDGAFSYTVNDDIESLNFKVIDYDGVDIYCTGKIIKLPDNFKAAID